jgi:hypothetical protein
MANLGWIRRRHTHPASRPTIMTRTRPYRKLLCALVAACMVSPAWAGADASSEHLAQGSTFAIRASVIAGGGVAAARGPCFDLAGTAAQPVAGTSEGGSYRLRSGFWGGTVQGDSLFRSSFEECQP